MPGEGTPPPRDPIGRLLLGLSAALAALGGLTLLGLAGLTVLNIALRVVGAAPIRGEFDVVSLGAAAVVFLFLPYSVLARGHVVIEFATAWAPSAVRVGLDVVAALVFAALAALLAWRMAAGGLEMRASGQETAVLHIPYWGVFALGAAALLLMALACLHDAWRRFEDRPK